MRESLLTFPFFKNHYNRNDGKSLDFYLFQNCYNSEPNFELGLFQKGENTMKTFIHNNNYTILIIILAAAGALIVGSTL